MTPTERALRAARACHWNRAKVDDATVLCIVCAAQIIKDAIADARDRNFGRDASPDYDDAVRVRELDEWYEDGRKLGKKEGRRKGLDDAATVLAQYPEYRGAERLIRKLSEDA